MEYRVLGPVTVLVDGNPIKLGGPRQQMVLATLLCHANHTVSQDSLIDVVWAGEPPEAARSTLQSYVYGLRRQLGGDQIVRHGDGYRITVDEDSFDSLRFERLVSMGRAHLGEDPGQAVVTLSEALGLWYGTPYGGLDTNPTLRAETERLEEVRLSAVEARIEGQLALGNQAVVIAELETLVREHPLRERFRAQQMLALYRCGRQAEALRAYQRARAYLADELGIDPSTELRDLEQRILEQDPSLELTDRYGAVPVERDAQSASRYLRGYEVRDLLGSGDFGQVYRAFQPSVGREVAIKIIRPEYANHPDFIGRFEREAQIVAQLEHPHIVPLFDFWRDPAGACLVMPYLRGGSLASGLRHGGWNLGPALRLLDQVAGALAHAHRRGIVHRDVKPENVLLDEDGNAYLSDFGIARRLTDARSPQEASSLVFVPPEDLRGEPHTARSDVFSLGILTFQLLTGVVPITLPLPPVSEARPGMPLELDNVLARATADNPTERFSKVEHFSRAVRQAVGTDVVAMPDVEAPASGEEILRNPYKGLRSFSEADAHDFYGRDALIQELLQAVSRHNLVVLVGASGSGKSSVVRAGLIPSLRAGGIPGSRHWLATDMFPGSYPFEELEAALIRVAANRPSGLLAELMEPNGFLRVSKQVLPGDDSTLLLLIDQSEELFSAGSSDSARVQFLDNLAAVASDERSRVKVVMTLRADFLARALEHAGFAEAIGGGLVTVGPPTRDGLAQAIAGPARGVGVELEPGLVGRIIADVENQPGSLPLLQYALTELFARRDNGELTVEAYEATGGVVAALSSRAEDLYNGLDDSGKEAARQLFLRLVTVGDGLSDSRRRARQSELRSLDVDQTALDEVLRLFGSFRLLSFDRDPITRGPTVEVAHEALLREWERLHEWIEERRSGLELSTRLAGAARDWSESGHETSYLLRGSRLTAAEEWSGQSDLALTTLERDYLASSRAHDDHEARRDRRRRRLVVGSLASGLLLAVTLAAFALWQGEEAKEETRQTILRSLLTDAQDQLDEDPELAILLGLEAARLELAGAGDLGPSTTDLLHQAIQESRLRLRIEGEGRAMALSPDGSILAVAGQRGAMVQLIDAGTGEPIRALETAKNTMEVSFASAQHLVLAHRPTVGSETLALTVWDPQSGELLDEYSVPLDGVPELIWSEGGRRFALIDRSIDEVAVTVIDAIEGKELGQWATRSQGPIAFVDDRTLVVTDSAGERLAVTDLAGKQLRDLGEAASVSAIAVDSASSQVLMVLGSQLIQARDLVTGEITWTSPLRQPAVSATVSLESSPAAGWVAASAADGRVTLFSLDYGREVFSLAGPRAPVGELAVDAAGARIAGLDRVGSVLIWDLSHNGNPVPIGAAPPCALVLSADGALAAITGQDGTFTIADLNSGAIVRSVPDQRIGWNSPVAIAPDWSLMSWVDEHGTGTVWADDGSKIAELPKCAVPKAFSADGSMLVIDGGCAAGGNSSRVIDPISGELRFDLGERDVIGRAAVFTPDGSHLAVVLDGILEIRDTSDGSVITKIDPASDFVVSLAYDPATDLLAVGLEEAEVVDLYDFDRLLSGVTPDEARVASIATSAVWGLAMGGDGILAASAHGVFEVWDVRTGELVTSPSVTIQTPPFSAFSPRGDVLYYVDGGHVIRTLHFDGRQLLDLAQSRVTRQLTEDECQEYLGGACPAAQA